MSKFIGEEVEKLQTLSDVDIMKNYVKHLITSFPLIITIEALDIVMKEKRIKPLSIEFNFNFSDPIGEKQTIQARKLF